MIESEKGKVAEYENMHWVQQIPLLRYEVSFRSRILRLDQAWESIHNVDEIK